MIQVTGYLNNEGTHFKDPVLELVPHLVCPGQMTMDVHIKVDGVQKGTIAYNEIDKTIFDSLTGNAYDVMIDALEAMVITDLSALNLECDFELD